jgi:hypothetical protein
MDVTGLPKIQPPNQFWHHLHTYHSRLIPEGVAEASQIFLRDAHVLPKWFSYTADVTGGKPITVWLQSISGGDAVIYLVAFTTSMKERERCYSFVLSRIPHETTP